MFTLQITDCQFIEDVDQILKFDDARNLCLKRRSEIDTVSTNLNTQIKNYIDGEDQYLREVQVKGESVNQSVMESLKLLEHLKVPTHIDSELNSAQKEFKNIELKLKQQEEQKKWAEQETIKQKARLVKLIEEIQLSILNKLDVPEPDNKTGIIFNWVIGCLMKKKKGPIQLAEELKLKVEKIQLQPESIINQPAPPQSSGIFACGGRKPLSNSRPIKRVALSEEESKMYENLFAWKAIKQHIFHQDFKFQEKVLQFSQDYEKLESFQIMLVDEMVSEKKEIIKGIYDIDIKDQARIIIEINEIVLFLLKESENLKEQKQKEQELEQLDQGIRQKEVEIEIMQKEKSYHTAKEKRISSLKSTMSLLFATSQKVADFCKEKMVSNDQIVAQIEVIKSQGLSKELKVFQDVEDIYRRKRQFYEEQLLSQQQKEEERKAQEESERKAKEEEDKKNQSQRINLDSKDQDKLNQQNEDENKSEIDQNEDEDFDEVDSDNSDQDGEKQDWIVLSEDPQTKHIQKTLFPDKVKTAENKNNAKQKNQGESLKTLMQKRKKN
ncbi:unnamed protein product [Paramecium primaurelia]|uniref:Uncharacterized protein n=1 Tax=Paramecium primaurelia TaxID=5886 RepID=A0A8S1MM57_PARPR|nr:unnamed protein product [Paramecium primaurelia]